jgi:hypothetical protein
LGSPQCQIKSKEPTKNKNKQKQPPDKTSKKGDDIHHLSEKLSNAAEMEISSRGKSSLIPLLRLIVHGLQIHGEIHSLCWWLLTCLLAELGKDEVEIFPCLFVVL